MAALKGGDNTLESMKTYMWGVIMRQKAREVTEKGGIFDI